MTDAQRLRAFTKWGNLCKYCGKDLFKTPTAFIGYSIDHLISRKAEGGNHPNNLIPACSVCNNLKGDESSYLAAFPWLPDDHEKFYLADEHLEPALLLAKEHIRIERLERRTRLTEFRQRVEKLTSILTPPTL